MDKSLTNHNIENRISYSTIDIAKFIMSVLVIMIHRPIFPGTGDSLLNCISGVTLAGVAVPFFFVASGFFFKMKISSADRKFESFKKYELRIFLLYFIWTIIYLPCIFVKSFTGHYSEITFKLIVSETIALVRNFFFSSSFVHFWYLVVLLWSIPIVFLLLKILNPKLLFALSCFAACVGIIVFCPYNVFPFGIAAGGGFFSDTLFKIVSVALPCISGGVY